MLLDIEQKKILAEKLFRGCIGIVVTVPSDGLPAIQLALSEGKFNQLGIVSVQVLGEGEIVEGATSVILNPTDPAVWNRFDRWYARALVLERVRRPWERLMWLLSFRVRLSPWRGIIGESGRRCYSGIGREAKLKAFADDWLNTLLLWPILTALLSLVICSVLRILGVPVSIELGVLAGVILGCVGAQPCSYVLGGLSCGAGAITIGTAFSTCFAIIIPAFVNSPLLLASSVRDDPFSAIVGGVVGITAQGWRDEFSKPLMAFMISFAALGIAASAWLMAQPKRAWPNIGETEESQPSLPRTSLGRLWKRIALKLVLLEDVSTEEVSLKNWFHRALRVLVAAIIGSSGIGLAKLFTDVLTPAHGPKVLVFTSTFAVTGAIASGLGVWMRSNDKTRAYLFGFLHALLAVVLCVCAFTASGTVGRILWLAAACGFFHSTWFTASFLLGEWMGRGTSNAKSALPFAAAVLESMGFVIFVLAQILTSKPH
jgi:hypothetical protein